MSKELREELLKTVVQYAHGLIERSEALEAIDRYAAERERQARIEEVTRIRKRVGGSTVATNEYRAWLDERISALKETTK